MTPNLIRTLIIISMTLCPLCLFLHFTQLGINMTPSLPYKLFLTLKGSGFQKGDLVTIVGHPTPYYPNAHFTKHVKGIGGDQITTHHQKLYINDEEIGVLLARTIEGHPLTPQQAQVIPEGMLFVAASHDRSFDSRYLEFGLVPLNKVVGRTIVLW
jgi:conjugal transfer pilin signal peptidase TrbI